MLTATHMGLLPSDHLVQVQLLKRHVDDSMEGNPVKCCKNIAATKNTRILTELLMEMKEMSQDIQWIKAEIAKSSLNAPGAGPEALQREETVSFPIVLPLSSEEQFNEAETALKEETVRRKMITRLSLVGGTSWDKMIRRMLAAVMTNALACRFNWAGKSPKRAFKETLMRDCMFAAARQFDRKLTDKQFEGEVQNWLRFAHERSGGVPRKDMPKT